MDNISEVYKGIYRVIIPLKGNPLKSINIYVIKQGEDSLVIDTGFNTDEILSMTKEYIRKLNINLEKTILFITHLHSDHAGLINYYQENGAKVCMNPVDAELLDSFRFRHGKHWTRIEEYGRIQGLGIENLKSEDHPGYKYRPRKAFKYEAKNPGDKLKIGDFNFEVVSLSGHTPGMVGLYDKEKSILFGGDHILFKITSNIQFWGFEFGDSLGKYLENLKKVKGMNIKHLYSSHRDLLKDVNGRIDQLVDHHDKRLQEAYNALKEGSSTVRDVTIKMKWDIRAKSWDEFPSSQKWFAVGEAHAHLERLRYLGKIDYEKSEEGILLYKIKNT